MTIMLSPAMLTPKIWTGGSVILNLVISSTNDSLSYFD